MLQLSKDNSQTKIINTINNYSFDYSDPNYLKTIIWVALALTSDFDEALENINKAIKDKDYDNLITAITDGIKEKYDIDIFKNVTSSFPIPLNYFEANKRSTFTSELGYVITSNNSNTSTSFSDKLKLPADFNGKCIKAKDYIFNGKGKLDALSLNIVFKDKILSNFRTYFTPDFSQTPIKIHNEQEAKIVLFTLMNKAITQNKEIALIPTFIYKDNGTDETKVLSWDNVKVGSKIIVTKSSAHHYKDDIYKVIKRTAKQVTLHTSSGYKTRLIETWKKAGYLAVKEI